MWKCFTVHYIHCVSKKKRHPYYICDHVAWTAACLCENWWTRLQTLARVIWTLLDSCLMWQFDFYVKTSYLTLYRSTVCRKKRCQILQGTVRTYETRCGGLCICACFKFPEVCFCQELTKLDDIWVSYNKYKKGDVLFLRHSVVLSPKCVQDAKVPCKICNVFILHITTAYAQILHTKKWAQFLLPFLQWNRFRFWRRFRHFWFFRRSSIASSVTESFRRGNGCWFHQATRRRRIRFQDHKFCRGINWNVFLVSARFWDPTCCRMNKCFATMQTTTRNKQNHQALLKANRANG